MDTAEHIDNQARILLRAWRSGDHQSRDALFQLLYRELERLSANFLAREGGISMSTGDLVNEAAIRLVELQQIDWQDKSHFMALAATTMRRILIEHARKKQANKREHQKVTLVTRFEGDKNDTFDLCHLDETLVRLEALDEDRARIVEMRYFGGMSLEQIAEVLGISVSTVKRSWRASRAWLLSELDVQ
jgi:RNA polymerase sigma factor (TIGR02999 family)